MNNAERAESWTNLGNLHLRLGNPAKATTQYERAIRLNPMFAPAYVNLADVLRLSRNDDEAERVLDAGLQHMPEVGSLQHAMGLLRVRQKRLEDALRFLQRAVELEPDNVRFRYVYAIALHSTGDVQGAVDELKKANAMRPSDRDVLIALINLYSDQGDRTNARRYAENLVRRAPWDRRAQTLLQQLSD